MFDAICEVVIHIKRQQGHEMIPLARNDSHPLLYFPELYWCARGGLPQHGLLTLLAGKSGFELMAVHLQVSAS